MRTVTALFIAMAIAVSAAPVPTRTEASVEEPALSLSDDVRKQLVIPAIVNASHSRELQLNPRAPVHGFGLFPDLKLAGEELLASPTQLTLNNVADGANILSAQVDRAQALSGSARASEKSTVDVDQLPAKSRARSLNLDLTLRPPGTRVVLRAPAPPPASALHQSAVVDLTDQGNTVLSASALKRRRRMQNAMDSHTTPVPDIGSLDETKLQDEVDNWIFLEAKRKYETAASMRSKLRGETRRLKEGDPRKQKVNAMLQRWEAKFQTTKREFQLSKLTFSKEQQDYYAKDAKRHRETRTKAKPN